MVTIGKRHNGQTNREKKLFSVVVPVFNESEVIFPFYERLKRVVESIDFASHELIFVDDGSKDDTLQKLVTLADSDPSVKVIKLSRNFGHQIAITAGIDVAGGDAVVVIDADLQDPPEVITRFVEKWEEGFDVVYGVRDKRDGESKTLLLATKLFYRILKLLANTDIPVDVGDFRLMSKQVVTQLKKTKERDRFVRGLVSWLGFTQIGVHYLRDKRFAGKTKYPYSKRMRLALDGITSFSSVPLKLASWIGYFVSLLAFLYACSVFVQKALGYTVQGWATIMVGMLFLGGAQLIFLGILGEYISRIFTEIKQRPMYVIEETYNSRRARKRDLPPLVRSISRKSAP